MRLLTHEDYIHFVEVLYFGAVEAGRHAQVLSYFAPGATLTGYSGDAAARIMTRQPSEGQHSLDSFMQASAELDLTYREFQHTVDPAAQRIASRFTLLIKPKPQGAMTHLGERCMKNCNFFQFKGHQLTEVVAYFSTVKP